MSKRVKITQHKLFFIVEFYNKQDELSVRTLTHNLTAYEIEWNKRFKRYVRKGSKNYFVYDIRTNEFRFPIKQISNFMVLLRHHGFTKDDIEYSKKNDSDYSFTPLHLNVSKNYTLRDYQEQYRDIIINGKESIYLIDASVGSGKGLTSCASICSLNMRTIILVLPKFVEKWIKDALEYTNVSKEDIYVVQGSESLISLMLEEDLQYKFIIISLRTFSNYLTEYEMVGQPFPYPVKPQHLMEHLKAGIVYNDETHAHFHAVSHAMLYLDALHFIGSTATFDSNNATTKKLYNLIIPPENRISNLVKRDPYVNATSIRYELEVNKNIKFTGGKGYNHNKFEQSLLRSHIGFVHYKDMIIHYLNKYFINVRKVEDKCLIFFASVDLCTTFVSVLKKEYSNLDIRRYCEGDPYDNILTANITCSTVLRSGTGLDIPNLTTVIQTISIYSLQSNIQSFGRLRKLKDKEVRFIWFWTNDIKNQRMLHIERFKILNKSFKDYTEEVYPKIIKTK